MTMDMQGKLWQNESRRCFDDPGTVSERVVVRIGVESYEVGVGAGGGESGEEDGERVEVHDVVGVLGNGIEMIGDGGLRGLSMVRKSGRKLSPAEATSASAALVVYLTGKLLRPRGVFDD